MVLVNYTTRELSAKLVYYGPGLCGKTTNLQYIYDNLLPPDRRGKMVSLDTETDRTLFFDFLPLELGTIRGLQTRLQLYTVPGQVHYNATRKIVLKGADGLVFVADSQRSMRAANLASMQNMKENLAEHGMDLREIPLVLQFNKRDLPEIMTVEELEQDLNESNAPFWESVATQGIGVEDTLKSVARLVLKKLAQKFQPEAGEEEAAKEAVPAPPEPARTAVATPVQLAPPEPEPPMLAATGELLSLDMAGDAPAAAGMQEEGEIIEVGDDMQVVEGVGADSPPDPTEAAAPPPPDFLPLAPTPSEPQQPQAPPPVSLPPAPPEPAPAAPIAALSNPAMETMELPRLSEMGETIALGPGAGVEELLGPPPPLKPPPMPEPVLPPEPPVSPRPPMQPEPSPAPMPAPMPLAAPEPPPAPVPLAPPEPPPAPMPLAAPEPPPAPVPLATPELPPAPMPLAPPEPAPEPLPAVAAVLPPEPVAASAEPLAPLDESFAEPLGSAEAAPFGGSAADDLPITLELGQVGPGMQVDRTLRVNLDYTDAAGNQRTRPLEVRLRFRLD